MKGTVIGVRPDSKNRATVVGSHLSSQVYGSAAEQQLEILLDEEILLIEQLLKSINDYDS